MSLKHSDARVVSRRTLLLGVLGATGTGVLAACGQADTTPTPAAPAATTPAPKAATTPAAKVATTPATTPAAKAATTPAAAVTKPAAATKVGGTVSVLASWGGDEQDSFMAMVKPFEDQTGTSIQYEGTRDLNAVLTTRVQGGNPPDVAGLPGPGQMAELARANHLIDLTNILDQSTMRTQYAEDWLKLGQVNGQQVGIFFKAALKGPIWYNPKAFQAQGYEIPKTWDATMELSERIAGTGTTPWSIGLESGAASGWPATDWLENIILRQSGPSVYDQWYQGQQRWTSPEIKQAWEAWGAIATQPRMVHGGTQAVLATNFGDAVNPLFAEPPQAYLHHQATFITSFITEANPNLKPVEDFNFFVFPDINPQHSGAIVMAGDLFAAFNDTPQSRALMQYLATPQAQEIWVRRGGALSPNKQVPLASYPDELARTSAQILTGSQIVRFDGSDLMPEAMNNAFWRATLDYVSNPGNLDSILAELDKVQADAYRTS